MVGPRNGGHFSYRWERTPALTDGAQDSSHRYPNRGVRLLWLRKPVPANAAMAKAVQCPLPAASLHSPAADKDRFLLRGVNTPGSAG
jgi:hypothetical protein